MRVVQLRGPARIELVEPPPAREVKPEQPIFKLAADRLGVALQDCVFVDDTFANVRAAHAMGMTAVHFTGEAEQLAEVERLIGLA